MSEEDQDRFAPPLGEWQFVRLEEELRAARKRLPNFRLANVARRHLAAVVHESYERQGLSGVHSINELTAAQFRQLALNQLGFLGARAASAGIVLVTSGYSVEAPVHLRRLIECSLRSRAVLQDASGQHAREWLQGRAKPSAARLAQKFGDPEELGLLDITAHADARGVALALGPELSADGIPTVSLLPQRETKREGFLLYGFAYESCLLSAGIAEAFGVAVVIPTWVQEQLLSLHDQMEI